MNRVICFLVLAGLPVLASTAKGEVRRFLITSSDFDSFEMYGHMPDLELAARITGQFELTYDTGSNVWLSEFDLRLSDVVSYVEQLDAQDFEGLPLQLFLPNDPKTMPGYFLDQEVVNFGPLPYELLFGPWTRIQVDYSGSQTDVQISASPFTFHFPLDNSHVEALNALQHDLIFKPLVATLVPEPSALAITSLILFGLSIVRSRAKWPTCRLSK